MTLPYSKATSGEKALIEIQKILRQFNCDKFGSMIDRTNSELLLQFEHRGKTVSVKANFNGYAKAYLKENPWSSRMRSTREEYEEKAKEIGSIAVYSILRDWIKAQVVMVEAELMSIEEVFLANIMLPNGLRVIEHVKSVNLLESK